MGEFLSILIPLEAAMLSPIWLPLLGVGLGKLADQIRGEILTPVEGAVRDAKARSAAQRLEIQNQITARRPTTANASSFHRAPVSDESVAA